MTAYRPRFVKQLDGSAYAGSNCTAAAGAMALDRQTLGAQRTTGARIRQLTGDTIGGLNQRQVANAIYAGWHQTLDVETPLSTSVAFVKMDAGMGLMIAGQEGATHGTKWQGSETFTGNHQWYVNERRRNSQVAGGYEHLVYDPLADGRRAGIATSPFWVPENMVLDFARRLNISLTPDSTYVPLGYGHLYVVFTRDTEPHVNYWGADVPAALRAVNHSGESVAIAVRQAGDDYGSRVDMADLVAAFKKLNHNYGSIIDSSDIRWLLTWSVQH